MRKVMVAFGVLAAASISTAAFAQDAQSTNTRAASNQSSSATMSALPAAYAPLTAAPTASSATTSVPTIPVPPISDQQLSQTLGPAVGIVVGQAQQLANVGGEVMQSGQSVSQQGASPSGGQLVGTSAGGSTQMGLQQGLALVPMPHL